MKRYKQKSDIQWLVEWTTGAILGALIGDLLLYTFKGVSFLQGTVGL